MHEAALASCLDAGGTLVLSNSKRPSLVYDVHMSGSGRIEPIPADSEAPIGIYRPTGRSAFAKQVVELPTEVRKALGLNDYVVAITDRVVSFCTAINEGNGLQPRQRLAAALADTFTPDDDSEFAARTLTYVTDQSLAELVSQMRRADRKRFLNQSLGTAAYDSFWREAEKDMRAVLRAMRTGAELLRPWALAMDDALLNLSSTQQKTSGIESPLGVSLFTMALDVDRMIGTTLASKTGLKFPQSLEKVRIDSEEIEGAIVQVRDVIRGQADENIAALGDVFARKIRGARDALTYSADGVSQAANSLVELLDRIARETFSEDEVLSWIQHNSVEGATYEDEGKTRPSKQAQFLCLAWAGAPPRVAAPGTWDLPAITAYSLQNIRKSLQKLKHADQGTKEERGQLVSLLDGIEATLFLMVQASWATAGIEHAAKLRGKLQSGAAEEAPKRSTSNARGNYDYS